jgi:prepilin-type processing-associated H-X9-DG protein
MATIKGRWILNLNVSTPWEGEDVNYTSKGVLYAGMQLGSNYVYFDGHAGSFYPYKDGAWVDEASRVVDFGETEQTVYDSWYNAFTANAKPMSTKTISGKWRFRDGVNPVGDFYATQKVSFTSRGVPFDTMQLTGDAVHYLLEGTHDYGFDGGFLTEDDALYRTVDFGETEQTVYYDWWIIFNAHAEQVDEDTEQKTIKGKWYFKRTNIIVPFDAEQKIRFASGGTLFDTMQFSADPLAVRYIMDGYYTYGFDGGFLNADEEVYREVDFGDTEKTVNSLWYTVFTANAVEGQLEQPELDQPDPEQPDTEAVAALQKQIDDLKLKLNELKNTPTFKLLWSAAELQEKMGGILDGTFVGIDGKDGVDGKDGADGKTPIKGVDYYTEEDKAEMVEAVAESMPEPSWDNLTDKPFGEEIGLKRIGGGSSDGSVELTHEISAGDKVIVTMSCNANSLFPNGIERTVEAVATLESNYVGVVYSDEKTSCHLKVVGNTCYPYRVELYSEVADVLVGVTDFTVDIEAPIVKTIDAKYIPVMDSLTLNGADGKQYKVSVDESGALVVTEI